MKKVPFPFVIEMLTPLNPRINPMFGAFGVYVREKIVFALRDRDTHPEANGVWIATSKEHHESLRREMPSLQSIYLLSDGKSETGWQMIPLDADDFETSVTRACELVLKNDPRIGNVPKKKRKK